MASRIYPEPTYMHPIPESVKIGKFFTDAMRYNVGTPWIEPIIAKGNVFETIEALY